MTSLTFWLENFEEMDHLLLDIKNFLKKLETGQLEIEAGQWELHKDLTNVKETIEEVRKLKKDVEEMKLNNVEAMQLIKGLENKLEAYKVSDQGPVTVSESSEEYEEIYKVPNDTQNNSKGYKKRKCHRILSEKIIEITSDIDSNHTKKQEKGPSDVESLPEGLKPNECTTGNKTSKSYREQKTRAVSDHSFLKKKRRTRKPDGAIMERYLNDSAKYRNRGSSRSLENKKPMVSDSICTTTIRHEPVHGAYWDKEKTTKSQQKISNSRGAKSSEKVNQKESVLPKQFFCSKCPKSFAFKSEYLRHQKHAHDISKPKFYCRTCKKFYDKKCRLKDHVSLYIMMSKNKHSKAAAYKCSYCNKTSTSPEQLTAHIKRCRIISKANFKKK